MIILIRSVFSAFLSFFTFFFFCFLVIMIHVRSYSSSLFSLTIPFFCQFDDFVILSHSTNVLCFPHFPYAFMNDLSSFAYLLLPILTLTSNLLATQSPGLALMRKNVYGGMQLNNDTLKRFFLAFASFFIPFPSVRLWPHFHLNMDLSIYTPTWHRVLLFEQNSGFLNSTGCDPLCICTDGITHQIDWHISCTTSPSTQCQPIFC